MTDIYHEMPVTPGWLDAVRSALRLELAAAKARRAKRLARVRLDCSLRNLNAHQLRDIGFFREPRAPSQARFFSCARD